MSRVIHDFHHHARQRSDSQPHPDAGEDDLVVRFDYDKITGRVVPGDGYQLETRTPLGQYNVLVQFSVAKQFSSDWLVEFDLKKMVTTALSSMGVQEDRFADITDSVFLAIDMAESPRLPLDVSVWDATWVDECEPTVVPAAASFIEGLERVRLTELQDHVIRQTPSCAICWEDFAQQRQLQPVQVLVTRLPCSHRYHLDCIALCLERSNLCPMCRYPMPTQDQANCVASLQDPGKEGTIWSVTILTLQVPHI
ncbi:PREDICTED: uncharacterized protein LOC101292859 [Fragaria vesca subsp. vesca]